MSGGNRMPTGDGKPASGYFAGGLPFNRLGHGPHAVVVFQGLVFENRPATGLETMAMRGMYAFPPDEFTVFIVTRRPNLPQGWSIKDLSDDYAAMVRAEFGGPVDIIGLSTGGSIAQHFAADHPDLVRRLVIHSSAYVLSDSTKRLQMYEANMARRGEWRTAWSDLLELVAPQRGLLGRVARPLVWLAALVLSLRPPKNPSDLLVTISAEDAHNFKNRLPEIKAPTLVVAGERDPFYPESLFRETAAGIPNAKLILYPGVGHPASGRQFRRDVVAFLRDSSKGADPKG